MGQEVSIMAAFLGGILAFLSPCVLPIIPGYIAYISGVSAYSLSSEPVQKKKFDLNIFLSALAFVIGFSIVFTLLGAGSTYIGQLLLDYKRTISQIAGIIVVILGIHFTGVFQNRNIKKILGLITIFLVSLYIYGIYITKLNTESIYTALKNDFLVALVLAIALNLFYYTGFYRILYQQTTTEVKNKPTGILGAFFVGVAFAFGWSPCIGPVLGAILLYASQQETVYQGMILLFSFSMGLGIPFIITAIAINFFFRFIKVMSKYFMIIEMLGGILLIIIGILLMFGEFNRIGEFIGI